MSTSKETVTELRQTISELQKQRTAAVKHVARLQQQVLLLTEVVATERRWRQAAWQEYSKRTQNTLVGAVTHFLDIQKGEQKAKEVFEANTATYFKKLSRRPA